MSTPGEGTKDLLLVRQMCKPLHYSHILTKSVNFFIKKKKVWREASLGCLNSAIKSKEKEIVVFVQPK